MSKQVQFRRGTAVEHDSFKGANGEITVDTSNMTLRIHDGILNGGIETMRKDIFDNIFIDSAASHNAIFRGKNLGTAITTDQWNAMDDGSFKDLYPGDYWVLNGQKYIIAHCNYYKNMGDSALTSNHLTMIAGGQMYTHAMNDTNITEGGWIGSKMWTEGLSSARTTIQTAFGSHLITHNKYLCNAVTNGQASAAAWTPTDIDLMNEMQVYGSIINGQAVKGESNRGNVGIDKQQFAIFKFIDPISLFGRGNIWLKDIVSATYFASVAGHGYASATNASYAFGVLPAFSIKK